MGDRGRRMGQGIGARRIVYFLEEYDYYTVLGTKIDEKLIMMKC